MRDEQEKERVVALSFSLPEDEAAELRERAKREDRSLSSLIRIAIRHAAAIEASDAPELTR